MDWSAVQNRRTFIFAQYINRNLNNENLLYSANLNFKISIVHYKIKIGTYEKFAKV